ncbi:unnamed protein product [Peniophora sp. CBMAI 1063]|nr:unnamed protein product [Peniophora sp. CBMAI 1063]
MAETSQNILHVVCDPVVELTYSDGPTNFTLGQTPIRIAFTTERKNDSVLEVVSSDPDEDPGATVILLRPLHPAFRGVLYLQGRGKWKPSDEKRSFMAFLGEAAFYFSLLTHHLPTKFGAMRDDIRITVQHVYRRSGSTALETRRVAPRTLHNQQQVYPVQQGAAYGLTLDNLHPHELYVAVLVFDCDLCIREVHRTRARAGRPIRRDELSERDRRKEELLLKLDGTTLPRVEDRSTQLWRSTDDLLCFSGKISCVRMIISKKQLPPWKELLIPSAKSGWDALTLICSTDTL